MIIKSKNKLIVLFFASFLVQSACTKDEQPIKDSMQTSEDKTAADSASQDANATKNFNPIYFDFDSSVVKDSYHDQVMKVSETLKASNGHVQISGHCDERGTTEYNLALGSRRATEVKNTLVQMGVPESKVTTISYGKEQPVDEGHNEDAWQKNRRAEFHVNK